MTSYARFGAIEVAYTRSGRGAPVLLLAEPAGRDTIRESLGEQFAVIAPLDVVHCLSRGAETLREFLEALGLSRPVVIAQGVFSGAVLASSREDQGAFSGVLILCATGCDCPSPGESDGGATRVHVNVADGVSISTVLTSIVGLLVRVSG